MENFYNLFKNFRIINLKLFLSLSLILLMSTDIIAQVTIPAANTNTANNRKPFGGYFGFERTGAIYTAAEHGMTSGSLVNSVSFYVNAVTAPSDTPVKIYMTTTTSTVFTSSTFASEITGLTEVYSGTITTASLVAGTWVTLPLTTPYLYNNNNLKILVEANAGGTGTEGISAKQFRWSAGAAQTWQSDNTAPAGTGTLQTTRPNVQLAFTPPAGPGTFQFAANSYTGNEGTTATITVNRVGGQTGTVSVNYATSNGTANAGTDYTAATGTFSWANNDFSPRTFTIPLTADLLLDVNETINITLSSPVGTTITGTNPVILTIRDVAPPLNGVYTVGTGGNFTSLTNTDGAFETLNLSGATGNITLNIISDLTTETGSFALNQLPIGITTLIKPFGAARTISGTSVGGLIKINGADFVTVNGSLGTTSRDLTIINTNVGTGSVVIWNASASTTNGATDNTFKNLIVKGQAPNTTLASIFSGSGVATNLVAEFGNDRITIQNNDVSKSLYGIAVVGAVAGDLGNLITQNDIGSAIPADYIGQFGMFVSNSNGLNVTKNKISNIFVALSGDPRGMVVAGNVINSTFDSNTITNLVYTGTSGYGGQGITVQTGIPASNLTFSNNMISELKGDSWSSFTSDAICGIRLLGATAPATGGVKLYHNSINLGSGAFAGNTSGTLSGAVFVDAAVTNVDIRNNILATFLVNTVAAAAKSYAIYSEAPITAFTAINHNDYAASGSQGVLGYIAATPRVTLAEMITGFGGNTNAINVAPVFTSASNLRLNDAALNNLGTPIASVTTDIDGDVRSTTTPDMGADEFTLLNVNEFDNSLGFKVYPNPTSDILNVEFTSELKNISVYNLLGQMVLNEKVDASISSIDLSNLLSGTYFVKIEANNTYQTIKVLKK